MGNHYDTLPAQHKNYDYVQDEDVNKKYNIGKNWYISPVLFLKNDKLLIQYKMVNKRNIR